MSTPLGLRRVRTPGRESRPSPVTPVTTDSWAYGPFRGPDASCTPIKRYRTVARVRERRMRGCDALIASRRVSDATKRAFIDSARADGLKVHRCEPAVDHDLHNVGRV